MKGLVECGMYVYMYIVITLDFALCRYTFFYVLYPLGVLVGCNINTQTAVALCSISYLFSNFV